MRKQRWLITLGLLLELLAGHVHTSIGLSCQGLLLLLLLLLLLCLLETRFELVLSNLQPHNLIVYFIFLR